MKTAATSWLEYRRAVENRSQPRTLRAFLAGMMAALDILADPYRCPTCVDKTDDLAKEIEVLRGNHETKGNS